MIEKSFVLLLNLILIVAVFAVGIIGFFTGLVWLVEFFNRASVWAESGVWLPFSILEWMKKYSVPVPHTEMVGFQNILDWVLDQSAMIWVFFFVLGCFGVCSVLSDLIIPMGTKKS